MSMIEQLTEYLENYEYEIVDSEVGMKVILHTTEDITIYWNPDTNQFEVTFNISDKAVTCATIEQVHKVITLYNNILEPNFQMVLDVIKDMFCNKHNITEDYIYEDMNYNVNDDNNLDIKAIYTTDGAPDIEIVVKYDYFIVKQNDTMTNYRYDSNKLLAIELPSVTTCIATIHKFNDAHPDLFTIVQDDPSNNIVLEFHTDTEEYTVEFTIGLCAASFLLETLYVNDTEVYLEYPLKNVTQLTEYRDLCIEKYHELQQAIQEQSSQESLLAQNNAKSLLENLVLRIFPDDRDITKDYISDTITYIDLLVHAGMHSLNLIWSNEDDNTYYTFMLDNMENTDTYDDTDELLSAIQDKLNEDLIDDSEENIFTDDTTVDNTFVTEDTISEENDPFSNDTIDTMQIDNTEELNDDLTENNTLEDPFETDNIQENNSPTEIFNDNLTNTKNRKSTSTTNVIDDLNISGSIKSVLQFSGLSRSIREDVVDTAETDIKSILNNLSAAEILVVLSRLF